MKAVLVLGAGLVSKPLVHYLLSKEFNVTVASRTVSKAERLVKGFAKGSALSLDVRDDAQLEKLISRHDLAISLLPYSHHVSVAQLCIKHKKDLITTSYVSATMQKLHDEAQKAGVILLNEIGLDPGIDHMSAMKIIDEVHSRKGQVLSFYSYCGGLPAFQHNNNAYGYKFSWSPRGVVMAGKNSAQYLHNDKVVFVPNRDLFRHYQIISIEGVGDFEAYPNRDSLPYQKAYCLKDAEDIYRGTLRNISWCDTMQKANELGLFDDTPRADMNNRTIREFTASLVNASPNVDPVSAVAAYLQIDECAAPIQKLRWLGLFDHRPIPNENNAMDLFCHLLQQKLSPAKGELDMIILYHRFVAQYDKGNEHITATLVNTGEPDGDSAMSRTVSLPAAIAANLILRKEISLKGVQIPVMPEIYQPVLLELEKLGIRFYEKTTVEK